MKIYDTIGAKFREWRSDDIGIEDIKHQVDKTKARSVLDLGCGNGYPIANVIQPMVDTYVGVDSSSVLLDEFKQNIPDAQAIHCSIDDLNLNGETFDLVFSFGCIFHLQAEQQVKALIIAAEAVSPGGVLIFNSGAEEGYVTGYVGDYEIDHWSLGEKGYVDTLTDIGMRYDGSHVGKGGNRFFTFTKIWHST